MSISRVLFFIFNIFRALNKVEDVFNSLQVVSLLSFFPCLLVLFVIWSMIYTPIHDVYHLKI